MNNKSIFEKMNRVRVLVVGDVMLDRYWWGSVDRISPEAPVPVVRLERTSEVAGGAANVAANVVGLGAKAILAGVVGDDAEGRRLAELLEEREISASNLIIANNGLTTVKTRIIAHSQQVVRLDQEGGRTDADSGEIEQRLEKLCENADVVIISDYGKGFLTDKLLERLITTCKNKNLKVFVDPKGKDYSKYSGASILTPNRREALEACKLGDSGSTSVDSAGKMLLRELGAEGVLITLGAEGMNLFLQGRKEEFAALARKVYDVTGAGDTVIATLATAVGAGADYFEAASLANIAAGLVVEQIGTTAISLDKLENAVLAVN